MSPDEGSVTPKYRPSPRNSISSSASLLTWSYDKDVVGALAELVSGDSVGFWGSGLLEACFSEVCKTLLDLCVPFLDGSFVFLEPFGILECIVDRSGGVSVLLSRPEGSDAGPGIGLVDGDNEDLISRNAR